MRRSCTALHELMRRSCMLPPALHAALEGGSSPLRSCPGQSLAAVRAAPDTLGCPWRTYVYVKVHAACGRLSASSSHADGQSGGQEALAARRTAARMPWPAASPLGRLHQNCRRRAAGATPRGPGTAGHVAVAATARHRAAVTAGLSSNSLSSGGHLRLRGRRMCRVGRGGRRVRNRRRRPAQARGRPLAARFSSQRAERLGNLRQGGMRQPASAASSAATSATSSATSRATATATATASTAAAVLAPMLGMRLPIGHGLGSKLGAVLRGRARRRQPVRLDPPPPAPATPMVMLLAPHRRRRRAGGRAR